MDRELEPDEDLDLNPEVDEDIPPNTELDPPPAQLTVEDTKSVFSSMLDERLPKQNAAPSADDVPDMDWADPAGSIGRIVANQLAGFQQSLAVRQAAEAEIMAVVANKSPETQAEVRRMLANTPTEQLTATGLADYVDTYATGFEAKNAGKKVASTVSATPNAPVADTTAPAGVKRAIAELEAGMPHLKGRITPEMLKGLQF